MSFPSVSGLELAGFSRELCIYNSALGIIKNINIFGTTH